MNRDLNTSGCLYQNAVNSDLTYTPAGLENAPQLCHIVAVETSAADAARSAVSRNVMLSI